jgi:transposase-like protein
MYKPDLKRKTIIPLECPRCHHQNQRSVARLQKYGRYFCRGCGHENRISRDTLVEISRVVNANELHLLRLAHQLEVLSYYPEGAPSGLP